VGLLLLAVEQSGLALLFLDGVDARLGRSGEAVRDQAGEDLGALLGAALSLDVAESASALDLLQGSHAVAADTEPHGTGTMELKRMLILRLGENWKKGKRGE
jgi:hypothetical protein